MFQLLSEVARWSKLTGKIFLLLFAWSGLYQQSVFIPNSYVVLNDSGACALKDRRNLSGLSKDRCRAGREIAWKGQVSYFFSRTSRLL
jgi:hypothetical protein